jgi:hypothetical protein
MDSRRGQVEGGKIKVRAGWGRDQAAESGAGCNLREDQRKVDCGMGKKPGKGLLGGWGLRGEEGSLELIGLRNWVEDEDGEREREGSFQRRSSAT